MRRRCLLRRLTVQCLLAVGLACAASAGMAAVPKALPRPASASPAPVLPASFAHEPPRVRAMLELGFAAETGSGGQERDPVLAAAMYCEAGRQGSAEGHYRSGLLHLHSGQPAERVLAKSFLAIAAELGHQEAQAYLPALAREAQGVPDCLAREFDPERYARAVERFDFPRYVEHMPRPRREVAKLVAELAPQYGIKEKLALAIAGVESNFDARAHSPKNAIGVMQLIPATAARFAVKDPWDVEQNIRGGLAYLRFLMQRFSGDLKRVVAAYNAGEGAVDRHGGVPPFEETRAYVARVMAMAR